MSFFESAVFVCAAPVGARVTIQPPVGGSTTYTNLET